MKKLQLEKLKQLKIKIHKNFIYQHSVIKDNVSKLGVIVSLETNEKNEKLNLFGKQLSMHIAASNPLALNSDEIEKEIIR